MHKWITQKQYEMKHNNNNNFSQYYAYNTFEALNNSLE